ncbi:MAG: hypothetical protein H6703_08680 [Myxococcales bacterium]|nr:hypothetical protein [Myxococcales bacterium]
MNGRCEECGNPLPAGADGEARCTACERTLALPASALGEGPPPTLELGQPPRTGPLFPRGRPAFPDKPQRLTLPQPGRALAPVFPTRRPTEDDTALDRTQESKVDGAAPERVDRIEVAEALARLDSQLGPEWTDLLAADDFPALLVKLERARRIMPGPAVDDAVRRVRAGQRGRIAEALAEFDVRIKADELEQADAVLGRVRRMADDTDAVDRATAVLARAWDDRHATEEGRLKLDRARELAAPPHPPRRLKQALKLYEDLLRRLDRYVGLRPAYELIKAERDEVERLVKAADQKESQRATAIAIGRIDVLVATLADYTEAKASGRLEEDYAQARIEEIEHEIGEKLAAKVDEFLQDADEIAQNPRDAHIALERLREHERLWHYLPPARRGEVERRAESLVALIRRRDEVIARCEAATALIEKGEYVAAIRQLAIQRELHQSLQIDVRRPLEVAVAALEQRLERRLDGLAALFADPYIGDADLDRVQRSAAELREQVEPVATHVPSLAALQARAAEVERDARRLRGELARCDRELDRVRALLDDGQIARARRLIERLDESIPPQRRADVTDLKDDLDLVIREDEVEGRLHVLALQDPDAALAWAERHPDNPACRQYRLHANAAGLLDEIREAELRGEHEKALMLATRLADQPPPALEGHVEAVVRHLERVIRDRAEVRRRIGILRDARGAGRLGEALGLFEGELTVPADLAGEWQTLREEALRVDAARLQAEVEAALAEARRGREAWQAAGWPDDDILAPPGSDADPAATRAHIDDALRALESAASAAAALGRRRRAGTVETTLHAVEVEQRVCRAEAALAQHDFESADAILGEPGDPEDPRVARARARLRRLAFGRHFAHAIAAGELAEARELIEAYGARSSDEVLVAGRVFNCAQFIARQVLAASQLGAREAVGGLREAHRAHAQLVAAHPRARVVLRGLRGELDEAMIRAIDQLGAALDAEPLPGAIVEHHQTLEALIEDDGFTDERLRRRRVELERDLLRTVRADLEHLESNTDLEILTVEQMHAVERRLDHLVRFLADDDPQLERCRRRVRQHRTTRIRRREAERRRDALVRQAVEELRADALHEACALEQDGLVDGDLARQTLERWRRAEPIVAALEEAMAARAFDRLAHLLDALERTESQPHIARLTLRDPFEGDELPAGISRLRELLPRLVAQDEELVARRAEALRAIDDLVTRFHDAICLVAADAPAALDADPQYRAYLDGAVRWAHEQTATLSGRLRAAAADDAEASGLVRRVEARLPPGDPQALARFLDARFRAYRADHRFAMACSQAPLSSLRQHREQLLQIRERWRGLPDLLRLVDDLLR